MCLNDNMESLIYVNELCNLYGLDTISAGATVAFAIECYENGLLTKADTDGLELTWGNSDAHVAVLKKMCLREGIGDVLADGAKWAAEKIGRGPEKLRHACRRRDARHARPPLLPGLGRHLHLRLHAGQAYPGRNGLRRARRRERERLRRHGRALQAGAATTRPTRASTTPCSPAGSTG